MKVDKKRIFFALMIMSIVTVTFYNYRLTSIALRDFLYLTRPIWDKEPSSRPANLIAHYYSPQILPRNICSLHNWTLRGTEKRPPRVIDAFTFSIELDMLEIRLRELWNVVDTFVIVEADKTFTGKDKPLVYQNNHKRFTWASRKIVHFVVRELYYQPKSEFENEGRMRGAIKDLIVDMVKPVKGDLIIVGDIDELPSAHTIELIKKCEGYPPELHLEMQEFLYSFEFKEQTRNWKPHVTTYDSRRFTYHHGHRKHLSNYRLADSGWHCSFCFRYISEFIFKMTSFSHSDRVTEKKLLERGEIQRKICDGSDIFDMLPDAYTFKDLISRMGKVERTFSTIGIPQYVVEHPDKFRFLLPGGCLREDYNQSLLGNSENFTLRNHSL